MARWFNNPTTNGTDKITVTQSASINNLAAFTWVTWFMPQALGQANNQALFQKGTGASGPKFLTTDLLNELAAEVNCATTNAFAATQAISFNYNQWIFTAMSYDTTSKIIRLYLGSPTERVKEATYRFRANGAGAEVSDSALNLALGNSTDQVRGFGGLMAWAGIWNVRLTLDQLEAVRQNPSFSTVTGSCVMLLPLFGVASPEVDLSGNSNTGALTGTIGHPEINHIGTSSALLIDEDALNSVPLFWTGKSLASSCGAIQGFDQSQCALPRATADPQQLADTVNITNQLLENMLSTHMAAQANCNACPTNGILTIDVSQCDCYNVGLLSPIDAIVIQNAVDGQNWCVVLQNNTGIPISVGGWPNNAFVSAPSTTIPPQAVSSAHFHTMGNVGAGQRHIEKVGFKTPVGPAGSGGKGSGGGVQALQMTGPLTFPCSGTQQATYVVTGGVPPYVFSTTKGSITQNGVLTPPGNSGSGVQGTAYSLRWQFCDPTFGGVDADGTAYLCNDSIISDGSVGGCVSGNPCSSPPANDLCDGTPKCLGTDPLINCPQYPPNTAGGNCSPTIGTSIMQSPKLLCDYRTGAMISAGCNPCGISMNGVTVSVQDARGVQVSISPQVQ